MMTAWVDGRSSVLRCPSNHKTQEFLCICTTLINLSMPCGFGAKPMAVCVQKPIPLNPHNCCSLQVAAELRAVLGKGLSTPLTTGTAQRPANVQVMSR